MVRPSFTVSEWCVTRRVSKSQFYKLKAQDRTDPLPDGRRRVPLTHNAGNKPLISPEADDEWIREAEASMTGDATVAA
jgi:hypothetical protein